MVTVLKSRDTEMTLDGLEMNSPIATIQTQIYLIYATNTFSKSDCILKALGK